MAQTRSSIIVLLFTLILNSHSIQGLYSTKPKNTCRNSNTDESCIDPDTRPKGPYLANIEHETIKNTDFRRVVFTNKLQLVYMSLLPREEIGMEVHYDSDQFFRFESGQGEIVLGRNGRIIRPVADGDALVVPAGTHHNVINTSPTERLQLYAIYTPPQHQRDRVDTTKPINSVEKDF